MKMKPFALATALLCTGLISQAQKAQIRGGLNLANISTTENGRVNEANQLTSFQVGIIGEVPLGTSVLSLQPGLLYTGKGSKRKKHTKRAKDD